MMSENISIKFHFFQFHGASLLFSAQDGAHGVGVAALKIQAIVEATLLTEDLKTTASVPRAVTDRYGTSWYIKPSSYELREWMAMDGSFSSLWCLHEIEKMKLMKSKHTKLQQWRQKLLWQSHNLMAPRFCVCTCNSTSPTRFPRASSGNSCLHSRWTTLIMPCWLEGV